MVQQLEDAVIRVRIDPAQAREDLARVEEERDKIRGTSRKTHAEQREEEREQKEGLVRSLAHEARALGGSIEAGYMLGQAGKVGATLAAIRATANSPFLRAGVAAGVGVGTAMLYLESLPLLRPIINDALDRYFAVEFMGGFGSAKAEWAKKFVNGISNLMDAQIRGNEVIRDTVGQISDLWEGLKGIVKYAHVTALLGGNLQIDALEKVFDQDVKWAEMMRHMSRYGDKARQVLIGEFIAKHIRMGF